METGDNQEHKLNEYEELLKKISDKFLEHGYVITHPLVESDSFTQYLHLITTKGSATYDIEADPNVITIEKSVGDKTTSYLATQHSIDKTEVDEEALRQAAEAEYIYDPYQLTIKEEETLLEDIAESIPDTEALKEEYEGEKFLGISIVTWAKLQPSLPFPLPLPSKPPENKNLSDDI